MYEYVDVRIRGGENMKYLQPDSETPEEYTLPLLRLPQVTPAQVIAKRQHYEALMMQAQILPKTPPFLQTPVTPPHTESLPRAESVETQQALPRYTQTERSKNTPSMQEVMFSTTPLDFSRSLRAGITYIPPTMKRHKEPDMTDALIACGTLLFIGLFLLLLLYYVSL